MDFDATKISELTKISRNTINNILGKIRKTIFMLDAKTGKDYGEFEFLIRYFGAKRVKGKIGRGAFGKTPVFGLLKRDGKVYVEIVQDCIFEQLMPIIKERYLRVQL